MSCFHVFCLLYCKDSKNVCNHADSTQFFCNFLSKILTKTCRGKVMKEKLKSVKTKNYFLLPNSSFRHRLGFALQNLRVDRAKGHVSSHETWSLAWSKVRYEGEKPKRWENEG